MATDLTKGNCLQQIVIFAIPMFIGNLFQQLYVVVDSSVVGKMIGTDALAAVGTSTPIAFFLTAVLAGFITGSAIITSQYFGAKDTQNLRGSVATSFWVVMSLGALMTVLGVLGARPILLLLRTPAAIMEPAVVYLQIYASSIFFQCLYQFLAAILRSVGDSKTPLYFLISACVINVVLDVVFVLYLPNPVAGVAWATFIAQLVSAVACGIYTMKKYPMFRFAPRELTFDRSFCKVIVQYGVPSSIQQIVGSVGMLCLQGLVNSFGESAMAAYTSAYKIDNFMMLPLMNLSVALSNFVGQNVGARQLTRTSEGLHKSLWLSTGFSLCASALIFVFAKPLMLIFVNVSDVEIIAMGAECLRALAPLFFLCGALNCFIGFFKGVGDVSGAMAISVAQIVIRILVAYSLAGIATIGIRAVWWCMPVTWVICSAMAYLRYRSGRWKKYNRFETSTTA